MNIHPFLYRSKRAFVCAAFLWLSASAGHCQIIESWPAKATDEYPRNSEGDVVALVNGELLVGWTQFQRDNTDFTSAEIVGRKSDDGGRTWGKKFVLQPNVGKLNTMSLSFLRLRDNKELLMFFLVKNGRDDLDLAVRRSTDEGQSWSDLQWVTQEPGYHIMNNARAIQLSSGRIVCPVSTTPLIHDSEHPLRNVCYFSDDGGRSWQRSRDAVNAPKRGAMEPGLVEKRDGTVLQIIRTQVGQIWFSQSHDQCMTWSQSRPWGVVSPESPATLVALPDRRWLLIHNPTVDSNARSHGGRRTPLIARVSNDEGQSWSQKVSIEDDLTKTYSYVSATVANRRVLLTYYVEQDGMYSLKFKSLPLEVFQQ